MELKNVEIKNVTAAESTFEGADAIGISMVIPMASINECKERLPHLTTELVGKLLLAYHSDENVTLSLDCYFEDNAKVEESSTPVSAISPEC